LEALVKRRSETASSAGINDLAASNVRIVDPAEVPAKPSSPKILINILLSLIAGLSIGIGLAFFLEYIDSSIKNTEELQQATSVPVLGFIPALRREGARLKLVRRSGPIGMRFQVVRAAALDVEQGPKVEMISHEDFQSKIAEAFREMRTALLVSMAGGPPKSILIASTQPGEGKTVVALNLAITLAQVGRKVLLVDADLRRPRQHRLLGVSSAQGLSTDLSGSGPLRAQPQPTAISGLSLVPSGPLPPNPADLLDSERFSHIQRAYEALAYDHIIYDSPPILAVADPIILAGRVDAVLLVVQAGSTPRDRIEQAMSRLQQVQARVLGTVLNRITQDQQPYYEYRYRQYHHEEDDSRPSPGSEERGRPGIASSA
ncbi:MAG: polysaccharide biosynthesis tyrosine autokinase, partial [Acidobacteriota bacterium]